MDRSRGNSNAYPSVIRESDILSAPMQPALKRNMLLTFQSLRRLIDKDDPDGCRGYTSKLAARKRLARITLAFRDYSAMQAKDEVNEEMEFAVMTVLNMMSYEPPPLIVCDREQELAVLL